MIGEFDLRDLLNSYGIDYKKVLKNNVNVISNGEYEEIKSVLSFLVKKVGISPKSIEKCPSILYLNTDNISQNYNYLLEHNFDKRRIERCLHVLSAKPSDLEETYDYVTDKYGRSLGWIFVDDQLLQSYLVENGYAKVAYIYGKYKYVNELCKLESEAINKELNIWKNMKTYEGYCNNIEKTKDNTILSSIMKGEYDKAYEELEENPNMIIMVLVLIIIFLLLIIFKKRKSI